MKYERRLIKNTNIVSGNYVCKGCRTDICVTGSLESEVDCIHEECKTMGDVEKLLKQHKLEKSTNK